MANTYLYHHGIKGMKWGVRKKRAPAHEDYRRAHDKKSVREMSDKELRDRNNRLQAERQYQQMTKKTGRGKKIVQGLIATAGTLAAAETAYKTYAKYANSALDKAVDMIPMNFVIENIT
jgi:chromosome segregation ATPase